uniref:MHC class I-like antigen recognition-like domain-containing protein n=1 Tax=Amphilophus citrinellus TaxID=61819 RepID=A0A3Q0SRD1_AMPCI
RFSVCLGGYVCSILCLAKVLAGKKVIHSLKYLTASSGVPNLPEFVVVGMVDDVPIAHYDSDTKKGEPTQDWMIKLTEDDPQHLEGQTALALDQQQVFKANFETLKQLFNHTGGLFLFDFSLILPVDVRRGPFKSALPASSLSAQIFHCLPDGVFFPLERAR